MIDKTTLLEYCNLPAIVGERFFSAIASDEKSQYISESTFVNAFVLIFNSELDNRLKLTFEM